MDEFTAFRGLATTAPTLPGETPEAWWVRNCRHLTGVFPAAMRVLMARSSSAYAERYGSVMHEVYHAKARSLHETAAQNRAFFGANCDLLVHALLETHPKVCGQPWGTLSPFVAPSSSHA